MVNDPAVQQQPPRESDVRRGRIMGGVVLVMLGVLFLLRNMYPWFRFEDYWPVILIAIGLVLMWKSRGRS
jgi:cell shape-determining protein MreD